MFIAVEHCIDDAGCGEAGFGKIACGVAGFGVVR